MHHKWIFWILMHCYHITMGRRRSQENPYRSDAQQSYRYFRELLWSLLCFFFFFVGLHSFGFVAWSGWYRNLSGFTFAAYGIDKILSATIGFIRIPEILLHILGGIGGFPGGYVGQKFFRHKTQKKFFRFLFWISALCNVYLLFFMKDEIKIDLKEGLSKRLPEYFGF